MSFNHSIVDGWSLIGFRKIADTSFIGMTFKKSTSQVISRFEFGLGIFLDEIPFELTNEQKEDLINATLSLDAEKPWGSYKTLVVSPRNVIKEITISPNARFSLQYHNHRSEIWTVVSGSGFVELNEGKVRTDMTVGDSVTIAVSQIHRMTAGDDGIVFTEIQRGNILDESDIVRLEDDYGRV